MLNQAGEKSGSVDEGIAVDNVYLDVRKAFLSFLSWQTNRLGMDQICRQWTETD